MPAPPNDPELEALFASLDERFVAELLDGALWVQPRPPLSCIRAMGELVAQLGDADAWRVLREVQVDLGAGPDRLVPDLAAWRAARWRDAWWDADAVPAAPDWTCEVLCARTEALDRGTKLRIYAREGVGHVWLVDPRSRRVEVLALDAGRYVPTGTHEGDARVRAEPFDAIELDLALLWAW